MRTPVFADVDTGIDDALALVYLLACDDVELVGVASTAGNVGAAQVCRNNLGLLRVCAASSIPVSRGADGPLVAALHTAEDLHGPTGLGYARLPDTEDESTEYDAAEAWVRSARVFPGRLVGVATGPLTNLALAVRAEPALPTLLRRLVVVGGRNTTVDPEAAAEVYGAWGRAARANTVGAEQLPLVCGPDITEQAVLTPESLHRLADATDWEANPLLETLESAVRFRVEVNIARGVGDLAYLHDPLAAAAALDPRLVETRLAAVEVNPTGAPEPGRTAVHWSRTPNVRVCVNADAATFLDLFLDRVGRFARRLNHS